MLEVEIKARVASLREVEERLRQRGARYLGEEEQMDAYFAHPCRDFAATDEALRLRRAGGRVTLTYKGRKLDAVTKTREEVSLAVESYQAAREILTKLGFEEVALVKKLRRSYRLGEYLVELDSVAELGSFVEVEKKAEEYSPEELVAFLSSLGIGREAVERRSYLELLLGEGDG
ncbi:MAG: class IV adenylate cyclase [Euryarchaeota archaeon]|nr:class IV adenylate cyclase [Euryarchaeota archaeon]